MDVRILEKLIKQLREIQADFYKKFGIKDIITNSKIFEVLIADSLNHDLIPGFAGHRDAKDNKDGEYEYKHYKETSSNHTWTFNDFSDAIFAKLEKIEAVVFAHIQDKKVKFPKFDWCYLVPGSVIAQYLRNATPQIKNNRKMVNISSSQIEKNMGIKKTQISSMVGGKYSRWIKSTINIAIRIEKEAGVRGILTSNKFWELLVALKLNHVLLSDQSKDDARDVNGDFYEYKVAKASTWSFEDISSIVLKRYQKEKSVILATVDKDRLLIKKIYSVNPRRLVALLKRKLEQKEKRYKEKGKEVRRLQVSLSLKDIMSIKAKTIF